MSHWLASDEPITADSLPSESGAPPRKRATPILTRRVKQAIAEWYEQGFNIGKPPYGYQVVVERHPVPAKAALGKVKRRLVSDPVRGPPWSPRSSSSDQPNTHPATIRTYRLRSRVICELCGRAPLPNKSGDHGNDGGPRLRRKHRRPPTARAVRGPRSFTLAGRARRDSIRAYALRSAWRWAMRRGDYFVSAEAATVRTSSYSPLRSSYVLTSPSTSGPISRTTQ